MELAVACFMLLDEVWGIRVETIRTAGDSTEARTVCIPNRSQAHYNSVNMPDRK
jgi:hypothetical protein